jgi:hypothetical protein
MDYAYGLFLPTGLTFFRLKRHRWKYAGLNSWQGGTGCHRADELALPGGNTDIPSLMSGIAVLLEAVLVIAEETRTPRSGPTVEPGSS